MKRAKPLKLPSDFLGTVAAFLQTPPPKRKAKKTRKRAGKRVGVRKA
jgi:hypothetical protein